MKRSWSKQVSTSRSAVLSLPSPVRLPCICLDYYLQVRTNLSCVERFTQHGSIWRGKKTFCLFQTREYYRGKYHCTIDLLFDWFGISCMMTDNFCFYLQNRLIQTSQTWGQWYSDTSPLFILPRPQRREKKCLTTSSSGSDSPDISSPMMSSSAGELLRNLRLVLLR